MDSMPPPSKQPRLELSFVKINDLADADLAEIFKNLPPYDRLTVSEVCCRWRDLSRMDWLDITHLDFSHIPGPNIGPIVKLCPNLRSVFALRKTFGHKELFCLSKVSLASVKLFECKSIIPEIEDRIADAYSSILSSDLEDANWTELVLHDLKIEGSQLDKIDFPASFPRSLKRLQLTGEFEAQLQLLGLPENFCSPDAEPDPDPTFLRNLEELQELECLILVDEPFDLSVVMSVDIVTQLGSLANLRELCFGPTPAFYLVPELNRLPEYLPNLEVLFLHSAAVVALAEFMQLVPTLTTLRILAITGSVSDDLDCPARKRFPNGFGSDPLPLLDIFLNDNAIHSINFAMPSDGLKIYQIDRPMSEFLDREDIAPLVEGVWIAEKIKEAAKHGSKLWDYDGDLPFSYQQPAAN